MDNSSIEFKGLKTKLKQFDEKIKYIRNELKGIGNRLNVVEERLNYAEEHNKHKPPPISSICISEYPTQWMTLEEFFEGKNLDL